MGNLEKGLAFVDEICDIQSLAETAYRNLKVRTQLKWNEGRDLLHGLDFLKHFFARSDFYESRLRPVRKRVVPFFFVGHEHTRLTEPRRDLTELELTCVLKSARQQYLFLLGQPL